MLVLVAGLPGDLLDGLAIGDVSTAALVSLAVLLILTGRLVPRRQLVDQIAETAHWRETAETLQKGSLEQGMAVHDLVRTVDRLLAMGEATNHALNEIQRALARSEAGE